MSLESEDPSPWTSAAGFLGGNGVVHHPVVVGSPGSPVAETVEIAQEAEPVESRVLDLERVLSELRSDFTESVERILKQARDEIRDELRQEIRRDREAQLSATESMVGRIVQLHQDALQVDRESMTTWKDQVLQMIDGLIEVGLERTSERHLEATAQLMQMAEGHRQGLAELAGALAEQHQKTAEALSAVMAIVANESESANQAAVDRMAELDKLCERLARRLSTAQKRPAQTLDSIVVEGRLAELAEHLETLQEMVSSTAGKARPGLTVARPGARSKAAGAS